MSFWKQLGKDINGEASNDFSGHSVSLNSDGTIVAIGAYGNDGNGIDSGHVRVYKYDKLKLLEDICQNSINFGPIGWRRLGNDIDGEFIGDNSKVVSLNSDGTIIAIGSQYNDGNGINSGNVRVYKYDANKLFEDICQNSIHYGPVGWRRLGQDIDGEYANDLSGFSVSLSSDGTILAIGAYGNDDNGVDSGHVRVYKYDATKILADACQNSINFGPVGWTRLGQDIDGEASHDLSGYSVSLSSDGTIVAIGAHHNNGNGNYSGQVRVYKYNPTKLFSDSCQNSINFGPVGWIRLGHDIDGESLEDQSGYSVSLNADGTILAIGGPYNDGNGSNSGHVRVYKYEPTKVLADNCQNSINYGPVGWNRLGQDINGEFASDLSGYSVSLSSDGTILAIGSQFNSGNGNNSGHARVYKYDSIKILADTCQNSINFGPVGWKRLGQDIDGEFANDFSGHSIKLSFDGSILAIGAYGNDGNGSNSGHARIYKYYLVPVILSLSDYYGLSFSEININMYGTNFDNNMILKIDGSNTNFTFISDTQISFIMPSHINGEVQIYLLNENGNSNYVSFTFFELPISNICFPSKTPITTDQGIINIENIVEKKHTIRKQIINCVTKTITQDKYLICIEKDAIALNIPSEKTIITANHKLFYKNKMICSKELIQLKLKNIYKIKYSGEILYNILLDKHDKMIVNNLICETLNHKNGIAKMYFDLEKEKYNFLEKQEFIKKYNNYVIKNNIFS
uniref:IPT/TIG domain-containing protein n=1 Tax=viral metagenome TaxID=1070528 RepID=A0A6C0IVE5_9ZZZZ